MKAVFPALWEVPSGCRQISAVAGTSTGGRGLVKIIGGFCALLSRGARFGSMTAMTTVSLQDARQAVVRDRVLEGVATLLRAGEDLTFAKVAVAADVPERTVYRHFPTGRRCSRRCTSGPTSRRASNGARATNAEEAIAAVRRAFPAFDELAPIVAP